MLAETVSPIEAKAKKTPNTQSIVAPENIPPQHQPFAKDVLHGLSQPQKTLPCRWLYDDRGSLLFERITELPEYYPTRTETAILYDCVDQLAERIGPLAALIEYGAGASTKTKILLKHLTALSGYVPIDVSGDFLEQTALILKQEFSNLNVIPVTADFTRPFNLPEIPASQKHVGFFPGSTIGNLSDDEIYQFLSAAHQQLGANRQFILGFDLKKSEDILIPAYNDAKGVTACFNLNILDRINRELGGNFSTRRFEHDARWNDHASRIEMHLVSLEQQTVTVAGHAIHFHQGESIHTENSRKFTIASMQQLCGRAEWNIDDLWMDEGKRFAVALLTPFR